MQEANVARTPGGLQVFVKPGQDERRASAMGELRHHPELRAKIERGFNDILLASYEQDAQRAGQSAAEFARSLPKQQVRERFDILLRWWEILRGDLHWSAERILDHLPAALATELRGERWTPPEATSCWGGPPL